MDVYHQPVLVETVIEGLCVQAGKKYIDATIGGGGHGWEIVKQGGILLGIDTDPEAVGFAKKRLEGQRNWKIIQGNFRDIEKIAKENGFTQVDGILFDLGISSHQLDTPMRGFSYRFPDAPLDLRLQQGEGETAASLIHRLSKDAISDILVRFGEEDRARSIAAAICRARKAQPIRTTGQLVGAVASVIPDTREQPAVLSRVFQALRIAVNDEMGALQEGLAGANVLLVHGGRLAVISFHSLEDRMVKMFLRKGPWQEISKKPMVADLEERKRNPRARSAKVRITQKL